MSDPEADRAVEGGESACWLEVVDDDGRITTRSDAVAEAVAPRVPPIAPE